jgi:hypothetical protein
MPSVLLAGVVCSQPKNLNPTSGKLPHMVFNLRPEGADQQIWKISAKDENELGVERLNFGDAVAIVGALDVGFECVKAGNRRVAFRVEARQILFLRGRSIAKAAAISAHEPALNGFTRPRVG